MTLNPEYGQDIINQALEYLVFYPKRATQNGFDEEGNLSFSSLENFMVNRMRSFSINYENEYNINNSSYLTNIISYDYMDYLRSGEGPAIYPPNSNVPQDVIDEISDPKHLRNLFYNYGEHELYLKSVFNNIISSKFRQAALELSFNRTGAPIGEDPEE